MTVKVIIGDALSKLTELPDESVHCCITSPPYWGLRTYGGDPGMIGMEPTFDDHLRNLTSVFREVWRVLRKDGTLWLNYGDAYAGSWGAQGRGDAGPVRAAGISARQIDAAPKGTRTGSLKRVPAGLKPKDLMMMPARVAMALQDDGWYLRSEIVWAKPNPMPESVTDRPTSAHEKIYLMSKSSKYFYDHVAVRTESKSPGRVIRCDCAQKNRGHENPTYLGADGRNVVNPDSANLRNVWTVATHPFKGAHFATFPPKLIEPCIKAGTSERGCCAECGAPWMRVTESRCRKTRPSAGNDPRSRSADKRAQGSLSGHHGWKGNNIVIDVETVGWQPSCTCDAGESAPCTVIDPFGGSGTVGLLADQLGRDAILIEINPDYAGMARDRIKGDAPLLGSTEAEE